MLNRTLRQVALPAALAMLFLTTIPTTAAGAKALVGSYALVKRVMKDGKELKGHDVVGFMTFTKTHRTVIMKWIGDSGEPVSISFIAAYTLSGHKYCETELYGVQSNLGAPGVSYDAPSATAACSGAFPDAAGLAFEVPNESLRLRVMRDGILATTPKWTDTWEKVK